MIKESPKLAAAESDVVFVHIQEDPLLRWTADGDGKQDSRSYTAAHVRYMVLADQGVLHMGGLQNGAILINLSPIGPTLTTEIEEKVTALNERRHVKMGYLDAAILSAEISGTSEGATNTIAAGGNEDVFVNARRLLDVFGAPRHVGEAAAAAQHVKIAQTIKLCSDLSGTAEALYYGHKAGLDLYGLLALIEADGYGSTDTALGSLMLRREFEAVPGAMTVAGFVDHLTAAVVEIKLL